MEELSETIDEIEAIGDDIADQRDACILNERETASDRDACKGTLKEVKEDRLGLRVTVRDYEKVIAKHEARVKPVPAFAAGVGTGLVIMVVLFILSPLSK